MTEIISVLDKPQTYPESWLYLKGDIVYVELPTSNSFRYVGIVTQTVQGVGSEGSVYVRVWIADGFTRKAIRYIPKWVNVIGRIDEEDEEL